MSDLTYISTGEGWLYLTAILGLAERKVVGLSLSGTMQAEATTVAGRQMTVRNRPLSHSLLFQKYGCSAFKEQLVGMLVVQSLSRKGNYWDNAVAESFFKTMKTEMVYSHQFAARQEARLTVFEYIKDFCNRK